MTVTLGWLLAQTDLRLRLVTEVDTSRTLACAHAIDLDDPTPWLSGGELVLVTGLRLARSRREQEAYVARLADAGVAGIGFGVGLRFERIPPSIVDACAERNLPLLEVPLPTPFIAITQAVARRLSEQELEALQRTLTNQRHITRAAVRSGLTGLVGMLSRELRCDCVVLDEYGAVMAASSQSKWLLERSATEYQQHARKAREGAVSTRTERGIMAIQSLRGRSTVVGWLVVHHREAPSSTDRLLLNQAAGLITLQLDWPAELIAAYHALGGTLLDLLLNPDQRAPTLVRHLHHFGFAPSDPVVLALVTASRRPGSLLEVVSGQLEATARPHVVTRVEGGVVALLPAEDARHLVGLVQRAAEDANLGRVLIGVSGPVAQSAVQTAFPAAEQAAGAARRRRHTVGWFEELSLGAMVEDEAIRSRIQTLAGPALEALERGTTAREVDLLPSLEAFLFHNGSWETSARALGVHRHTMRARMARVEELTGLSLDSADTRVLLMLALMSRPGHGSVMPSSSYQ